MEFRYLRSFLVLAEELHFGRAAARLHLAQPSLSQQLQRLERHVGVTLVDRSSHHVRLTDAGSAFRVEAQRVLDQVGHAVTAAREVAAGRVGTLDVGFNSPAGLRVLPPTLALMDTRYPGVGVRLSERRSGPQLEAVAAGELDVALVFGRPRSPALRSREVMTLPVVAVVGRQHPLAGRAAVTFGDLARQRCLLVRRELTPALHDAVVGGAARAGVDLDLVDAVDDTAGSGILLAGHTLVGFVSAVRATDALVPWLCAVPIVDPVPTVPLRVTWRDGAGPLVEAFLECLEAAGPFRDRPVAAVG